MESFAPGADGGRMKPVRSWLCSTLLVIGASGSAASSNDVRDLRFFEGSTESVSTMKIVRQRAFVSRSVGRGRIRDDGSLELVQQVSEDGRRRFDRRWQIRWVAPGRFTGTMSEATG